MTGGDWAKRRGGLINRGKLLNSETTDKKFM
jgi:hypothetical protein